MKSPRLGETATTKNEAKEAGVFRRDIVSTRSSFEIDSDIITIEDCWLQQNVEMRTPYGPFVEKGIWRVSVRTNKQQRDFSPSYFNDFHWQPCIRMEPDEATVYFCLLRKKDVQRNQLLISFDKPEDFSSGIEPSQVATLSWENIPRYEWWHIFHGLFALTVYVFIVLPALVLFISPVGGVVLHEKLIEIQTRVYSLRPKPWR